MSTNNIAQQFSVFGDFSSFDPSNTEWLSKVTNGLKELGKPFFPNTITQTVFSGNANQPTIQGVSNNRTQLFNDEWQISVLCERLDIAYSLPNDMLPSKDTVFGMLEVILSASNNPKINRVALNLSRLFAGTNASNHVSKYAPSNAANTFYNSKDLSEWSVMLSVREKVDDYVVNVISNVSNAKGRAVNSNTGLTKDFEGLIQYDINTAPEANLNFELNTLKNFFDKAFEFIKQIEQE
jgi:hypothetical protein